MPVFSLHLAVGVFIERLFIEHLILAKGFPGGSVVKNPPANAGDLGSIPGSGRFPWRKKWQPTPVFFPGKSHGQRILAGYDPWGHKSQTQLSD